MPLLASINVLLMQRTPVCSSSVLRPYSLALTALLLCRMAIQLVLDIMVTLSLSICVWGAARQLFFQASQRGLGLTVVIGAAGCGVGKLHIAFDESVLLDLQVRHPMLSSYQVGPSPPTA